jgi:hypothetical protein
MLKWNEAATEAASKNEEVRSERNRRQDDDFCRALRAARRTKGILPRRGEHRAEHQEAYVALPSTR